MDSKTISEEQDVAVEEVNNRIDNMDINADANEEVEEESNNKDKKTFADVVKDDKEKVPPPSSSPPPVLVPIVVSQCAKDEYLVKTIDWKNKKIRIITQNENGPCPLVAICNVLFLRGDLEIMPPDREVVTFEYLVDRLGDYLLTHEPVEDDAAQAAPTPSSSTITTTAKPPHKLEKRQETTEFVLTYRHNLDTALSILPNLKSGLNVNVKFDSIRGFEPTAELAMFDLFNVDLVHGWIADPQDRETYDVIVNKCGTYNHTVEKIVQADELSTRPSEEGLMIKSLTLADEEKLHQGFVASEFLKDTATQLTYYGLDLLLDSIPHNTLCVLFRNNHFSTLYRYPESGLYMLVTDSGLVLERSIIWESLGDVDQGSSEFFNGNFMKPHIQENTIIPDEVPNTDLDYAIAVSMQDEQDRQQGNDYHGSQQQQQSSNTAQVMATNSNTLKSSTSSSPAAAAIKNSDNSKCIIS